MYIIMKRFAAIFVVALTLINFLFPVALQANAQTGASLSATPATVSSFPTLLPTTLPSPTPRPFQDFPLMQQFELTPTPIPQPAATLSAEPLTPGYSEEYCLDVPVIMYHHIEPLRIATEMGHEALTVDSDIFEDQIEYLVKNKYHFIALEDLITALYSRGSLPLKSVVITIDDGYMDNYAYAFMTAKKYKVIMNFMIPTGLIDTPGYMTWDHLLEMRQNPYAKLYNHTTSHAGLGVISKAEIIEEVSRANQDFATKLNLKNDIVVYPYGSYSDEAVATLKELGMRAGVSTDPGRNECTSSIMKLPRVRVGNAPLSDYGY